MPAPPEAAIDEHGVCGVVAWSAGDAPARMSAGTAQVKAPEGQPIVRSAYHRPRAEQLVEAHLAGEDVATDEAEAALEVERRMDLAAEQGLGEARRVGAHGGDDLVGGFLALLVPAPPRPEILAEMLAEQARHMLAPWRKARVKR